MKKISFKKGQMRAKRPKLWKTFFMKKLLLGSHCLHWLQSMVQKNLELRCTIKDTKGLPDNRNKW